MSHMEPGTERPRFARLGLRALVLLSFVWLAALGAFWVWANATSGANAEEAGRLVRTAREAVQDGAYTERSSYRRLGEVHHQSVLTGDDVLDEVPAVAGAEPFQFLVDDDGDLVIGYRGTTLAAGVCVAVELSPGSVASANERPCRL